MMQNDRAMYNKAGWFGLVGMTHIWAGYVIAKGVTLQGAIAMSGLFYIVLGYLLWLDHTHEKKKSSVTILHVGEEPMNVLDLFIILIGIILAAFTNVASDAVIAVVVVAVLIVVRLVQGERPAGFSRS